MARHHHLNDFIWRALSRAGIPSSKERSGLSRTDGKRPDGMTLNPWQAGRNLLFDATVVDTLVAWHLPSTSRQVGCAGEKKNANTMRCQCLHLHPNRCETLGPINTKALSFLADLGHRIALVTGDPREGSFLFQRLSITVQRFNSVCFKGSFTSPPDREG